MERWILSPYPPVLQLPAGTSKVRSKVLYFDGGYVYSTNAQSLIRYLVNFSDLDNAPKPIAEITMVAHIDEPVMSIIDPAMRERTWMAFYYYPSDVTFESASFGSGRIMNAAARDNSTYTYQYFITDHLGSTRMVVDGNGVPLEATEYYPYGTMVPVTPSANPEVPAREQFTGKEFDTEGEDVANGAPGIQCYYFGARYYDPEIGVWGSCDKAGQFASGYGYGTSPVIMVDEDGNFIWVIPLLGFAVGYIRAGSQTGDWGWQSVKAGLWTGAAFTAAVYAPVQTLGVLALNQGCQNVLMNNPDNYGEAFGQFFMGAAEGALDFTNIATLGFLNGPTSYASGTIRGQAYNWAHGITGADAQLNISEARKMNHLFGSYLGQGNLVKAGSDFMFDYTTEGGERSDRYIYGRAKRLYAEGGYSNENKQYLDFIHKHGINEEDIKMKTWTEKKQGWFMPQFGHGLFGTVFSHKVWHQGFESYGEPYEAYNKQDYSDDWGLGHWYRNYF